MSLIAAVGSVAVTALMRVQAVEERVEALAEKVATRSSPRRRRPGASVAFHDVVADSGVETPPAVPIVEEVVDDGAGTQPVLRPAGSSQSSAAPSELETASRTAAREPLDDDEDEEEAPP